MQLFETLKMLKGSFALGIIFKNFKILLLELEEVVHLQLVIQIMRIIWVQTLML